MADYKYKGFVFIPTSTMTKVNVLNSFRHYYEKIVPLYEIDGLKDAGKRPFLTSIRECKEYISMHSVEPCEK